MKDTDSKSGLTGSRIIRTLSISLLIGLVVIFSYASFKEGLFRSLDKIVPSQQADGPLPTALSYLLGHPKNYLYYYSLQSSNSFNTNAGIEKILNSRPSERDGPNTGHPGVVDFDYLAFVMFGPQLESIYYFYFLLLFISILMFILCFYDNIVNLLLLLFYLLAFYFVGLTAQGTEGLTAPHTISYLGYVALMHVLLLIFDEAKFDGVTFVSAIYQSLLIILVIACRSTFLWALLCIMFLSAIQIFKCLSVPTAFKNINAVFGQALRMTWPALLILILCSGYFINHKKIIASTKSKHTAIHWIWHNMLWGFGSHPVLASLVGFSQSEYGGGTMPQDHWSVVKIADYLKSLGDYERRRGLTFSDDVNFGAVRNWVLYEEVAREYFFHILKKYPIENIENYFYYKPKRLFDDFLLREWHDHIGIFLSKNFLFSALLFACVLTCFQLIPRNTPIKILAISGLLFSFSLAIPMVYLPYSITLFDARLAYSLFSQGVLFAFCFFASRIFCYFLLHSVVFTKQLRVFREAWNDNVLLFCKTPINDRNKEQVTGFFLKVRTALTVVIVLAVLGFVFYAYVIWKSPYARFDKVRNSTLRGTATASTPDAEKLVDGIIEAPSMWNAGVSGWWKIDFGAGSSKSIVKYIMYGWDASSNGPTAWTFEGSNDDVLWDILDIRKDVVWKDNEPKINSISSPAEYRYYRLNIKARNSTLRGTATASTPDAEKLVDGIIEAPSMWNAGASGWWKIDFGAGSSKSIVKYIIYGWDASSNGPAAWTFEGSNDDVRWTILDIRKDVVWKDNEIKNLSISSPARYRYYRLNVSAPGKGGGARLLEMELLDFKQGSTTIVSPQGDYNPLVLDPLSSLCIENDPKTMTWEKCNEAGWITAKAHNSSQARKYFILAVAAEVKLNPKDAPGHLPISLTNLAGAYLSEGNTEKAEHYLKLALGIYEKNGAGNLGLVESLNNLADLYRQQGKPTEAEQLIKRALSIRTANQEKRLPVRKYHFTWFLGE